ncbi:hypothetical protein [Rhizobium sp. BT03]|uniref:hypothetical protein n=1 Tax=Rhizobium sp. BT03 TaxID=3045156 RepID=UPI0024B3DC5E|nr:hypothetical protein [Rhizobium sp. BT03]WHO75881.1 hypothetical protein QMO80_004987 [Rhizobium sp. BT03]
MRIGTLKRAPPAVRPESADNGSPGLLGAATLAPPAIEPAADVLLTLPKLTESAP